MLRDLFSLFPAYAGVIPPGAPAPGRGGAFPRIRGGDPMTAFDKKINQILFPAYAGVIPRQQHPARALHTFPRIRGGDP